MDIIQVCQPLQVHYVEAKFNKCIKKLNLAMGKIADNSNQWDEEVTVK
jgi:hypothetical protein